MAIKTPKTAVHNPATMNGKIFFTISVTFVLLVAGCATPPTAAPVASAPGEPVTSQGVKYEPARNAALALTPRLSADEVFALIGGLPDQTASRTYGGATRIPWQGVRWEYIWHFNPGTKRLILVFEIENGKELLNNWQWYDY